jgi:hypothetical protein
VDSDEEGRASSTAGRAQERTDARADGQKRCAASQDRRRATAGEGAGGEEEIVFVSASGGLGGDLPHPRALCPTESFKSVETDAVQWKKVRAPPRAHGCPWHDVLLQRIAVRGVRG